MAFERVAELRHYSGVDDGNADSCVAQRIFRGRTHLTASGPGRGGRSAPTLRIASMTGIQWNSARTVRRFHLHAFESDRAQDEVSDAPACAHGQDFMIA